jgi:hypothetical protein
MSFKIFFSKKKKLIDIFCSLKTLLHIYQNFLLKENGLTLKIMSKSNSKRMLKSFSQNMIARGMLKN